MILFINVIVTEDRHPYPRYHLPNFSRLDIFKYVLASYAIIPWSKVIIYAPLDRHFTGQEAALEQYVYDLFGKDARFYHRRNTKLSDWQEASKEVIDCDDNLIWFTCNDDHVFIDYDLEMVKEACELLEKAELFSSCYFSHWHEVVKCCCSHQLTPPEKIGNFVATNWNVHDSIQILRKELFLNYWKLPLEGHDLRRSDNITFTNPHAIKCFIPLREMCRHFDGYAHSAHAPDFLPPLTIPPGFWENDIKILYCGNTRRDGWVSVDPTNKKMRAVWPKIGVDMRCMLEDLPLFWRQKISKIETENKVPKLSQIASRDELICHIMKNMPLVLKACYGQYQYDAKRTLPIEWLDGVLRRKSIKLL